MLAYVEKKGALKEDEGKFLFHQLCAGVKYLHDAGVIHRDLKPENLLLLEEDGVKRLKLADFGFANIVGDKSFVQSVVGTPAYVGQYPLPFSFFPFPFPLSSMFFSSSPSQHPKF